MRLPEPFKYLAGSILIYYVMAACSAPGGGASSAPTSSNPGATSSGGGPGAGGSGGGTASGGGGSSGGASGGGSGGGSGSSGSPVPDANADTTQSGSRLKAAYYVGSDGSKQFAEWQDSARGSEVCQFENASDGTFRCLPTTPAYAQSYYSNSTCTDVLGWTEGTCVSTPHYAYTYVTSSCPYRTQVFPIVGPYTGAIYVGSSTSCTATTASPQLTYYTIGAEIPPSSFQSAQIQVE